VTRDALAVAIAAVPDDFLTPLDAAGSPSRRRAAYHAFLWKRLKKPRPFVGQD
jgi:hypothetical protein